MKGLMLVPPLMLLAQLEGEERQFIEGLYAQFHQLMYAAAYQVLRDQQLSQDAVGDALLSLMKKISLLETLECNKLKAYVVITVRNTALNTLRSKKREPVLMEDALLCKLTGPQSAETSESYYFAKDDIRRLKEGIRALPPKESRALMLRYFTGWTDEEIARSMGLKAVSVRSLISRGRQRLFIQMKEEARDE